MGAESPKPASAPTGAVFLSYASQDAEAAQKICDALRAAGIEVWFDKSELRGGEAWDRHITKQIRECGLFLAVISAHTEERSEGYFRREWRLAVERMRDMADDRPFLLPAVIDATREDTARVPDRFREFQWIRLPAGETSPTAVERIQRLRSATEPIKSADQATPAETRPGPSRDTRAAAGHRRLKGLRPALLALAFVVIAAGIYIALDRFVLSKHSNPVSAVEGEKSIAVLPFVDLSEKHDQEYFADGMAEQVIDLLVNVPGLRVIGRTSSFQFKGKNQDLRAVGEALGVNYVVEGSVRKSADRIRVTAQLIDARLGSHLWSETYDRAASDALLMQDEIAATLARSLEIGTGADRPQSVRRLKNDAAYDLYLRGRFAAARGDADGLATGITYLRQALDADPGFADAAVALALTYYDQAFTILAPSSVFAAARQAAESALKLNPRLGLAHAILGGISNDYDWDWAAADRELKEAIALAPHDGLVLATARGPCRLPRPTGCGASDAQGGARV